MTSVVLVFCCRCSKNRILLKYRAFARKMLSGGYGSSMGYGGGMGYGSSMGYGSGMGYGSSMGYGGGMGTSNMMMQRRMQQQYGGGNMYNGMNGGLGMNEPLPPTPAGAHAPIAGNNNHNGALVTQPSADETAQQRRARRREERRIMKQQEEDRKAQRRTFLINASMELFSHGSQILMHSIRSCYELLSIAFGAYYSIRAMRQFFEGMQQQQQPSAVQRAVVANSAAVVSAASSQHASPVSSGAEKSFFAKHGKKIALFLAAIAIGDLLLSFLKQRQTAREHHQQQMQVGQHNHHVHLIDGREIEEDEGMRHRGSEDWSIEYNRDGTKYDNDNEETEEEDDEEEDASTASDNSESRVVGQQRAPNHDANNSNINKNGEFSHNNRRAFVALYDSVPDDSGGGYDHLAFRQGDQLFVDNYVQDDWCEATIVSANGERRRGVVPGNYIVPVTIQQKF
ncbi:transmembrane protein, putative [Bodo saltans]|uniref:Transmembrane protein, putative n=1 Tax=Bodo saltans TaxID=75058 RepID=A0A0S4J170_BODSA|nr:transmembrane protein, putative [Bodo saltans]|eukprot:CUG02254.1 transmembrane protein, putative [Bodo saltans]